jgi:hypothetical protein
MTHLEMMAFELGLNATFFDKKPAYDGHPEPDAACKAGKAEGRRRLCFEIPACGSPPGFIPPEMSEFPAHRAGMTEKACDQLTGHEQKTVARSYGQLTVPDLAAELAKFPVYRL